MTVTTPTLVPISGTTPGITLFPEPPQVVELVLPYPPSVNMYWRSFVPKGWRRPAVYISDEGKQYRHEVRRVVSRVRFEKMLGPVMMEAVFYCGDRRRRDIDNPLKSLLDSMKHAGVYADDSQIREMHLRFGPVVKEAIVRVKLTTMGT